MAKHRYIIDIESWLETTRVIEADNREEAEAIFNKLLGNKRFLDDLQAEFGGILRDDHCFGDSLEWDVAHGTDTDPTYVAAYGNKPAANDYLEEE